MRWIRYLLPLITRTHRVLHRVSRGRLGDHVLGFHFLILEHVGRKSGLRRETPLLYVETQGRLVVAASNAGQDRHPAWWLNLRANPHAAVQIGRKRYPVRARRASGSEEGELWRVLEESWRWFGEYRAGTEREIPVIVLERDAPVPDP